MYDEQKAKDIISDQNKAMGWETSNIGVISHREFFVDGELLTLEFDRKKIDGTGKAEKEEENFIYIVGSDYRYLQDEESLINHIGSRTKHAYFRLLSGSYLAGLLAIMIVFTLIVLVFITNEPEYKKMLLQALISGFSLVVGYFFGKASA